MVMFFLGMVTLLGAECVVVLACVYLIDWDQAIRDATVEIEKEWQREESRLPYDQHGGCL